MEAYQRGRKSSGRVRGISLYSINAKNILQAHNILLICLDSYIHSHSSVDSRLP